MGSQSDWETLAHAATTLRSFDIAFEAKVVSAHRTPEVLWRYASTARKRGLECFRLSQAQAVRGARLKMPA